MDPNENIPIDRLHREAMAERPPFSDELHRRTMRQIRASPARFTIRRRITSVAAAIVLTAGALSIEWIVHAHRPLPPAPSVNLVEVPSPVSPDTHPSIPLTLNLGGVVSARFWPPELAINLPILDAGALPGAAQVPAQPQSSYEPPGSPEWLFSRLQIPASSAQAALADVIPGDLRAMAKLRQ